MSLSSFYIFYFFSIFIYFGTILLDIAFIIPLQAKEALVKNGLSLLRKQLLVRGVLGVVVAITSILALSARFFITGDILKYSIISFIVINSLGMFGKSIIDYLIYHQQYTDKNMKIHREIARKEKLAK